MVFNDPFNEQLSLCIFLLLNKPGVGEGVGGSGVLGGGGDGGCVDGDGVGGLGVSGFEPTLLSIQDLK